VHWEEECHSCRGYYWMYQWHRFIQVLAHGKALSQILLREP